MREYDTAVSGEPDTDLDDVHHDWGSIDLAQDAWLAHSDQGDLCAYAAVLPHQAHRLRLDIYTTPGLIEGELAGKLLDKCLERSQEISAMLDDGSIERLVAYILHSNVHYRKIFERAGFEAKRFVFQMRMEMQKAPRNPRWPAGIQSRKFVPGEDDSAAYEIVQEAFERPGRERPSFEEWKKHMLRPGSYKPELWTLAFAGRELVGVCLGFDYPDEGWVRQLAVRADWRGRGLGSALLRNAFTIFYDRGKRRVGLTTESDNPDALAFYERIGMSVRRQYDEYIKTI
jgi:ribosomal protein S18 acetylase RimI-like enzyme